jgi:formamidopyrimidine-DNA glycosylase
VLQTALRQGRRVAGVGRCYASELMWAARLPPLARTDRLDDEAWARLARATEAVLGGALARARETITTDLPDDQRRVTAVHGHHGEPCLRCGRRLERVGFSEYELVYCPDCQTGGRVYADRRMSRLLR